MVTHTIERARVACSQWQTWIDDSYLILWLSGVGTRSIPLPSEERSSGHIVAHTIPFALVMVQHPIEHYRNVYPSFLKPCPIIPNALMAKFK